MSRLHGIETDSAGWIWVEPVAFDPGDTERSVGRWLRRTGFIPDAVSLLHCNADFIHTHTGFQKDRILPSDYCSYMRPSQGRPWTSEAVRKLVATLHRSGVAVYISVFDVFVTRTWIGQNENIFWMRANGECLPMLCPFKHLANGSLYEEFFADRLAAVLRDYEYDGFHCPDGYAHPRIPLSEGDFSDDMIEQWIDASGVTIPDPQGGVCDGLPMRIAERAAWIWREKRSEWIAFRTARTTAFIRRLADTVHAEGKKLAVNSAWTKDPLEAVYRYGVDYRQLATAGVDTFVTESGAGSAELDGYEAIAGRRALYGIQSALLLAKACAPQTPMVFLSPVNDTTEGHSMLRHMPTALEREIYLMAGQFYRDESGELMRCAVGQMTCLGDGMSHDEWRSLRQWRHLGFAGKPRRVMGATLVWAPENLPRELADYIATRRYTPGRLLDGLLERAAPICSIAHPDNVLRVPGPLLVLNPQVWAREDLARLLAGHERPVIVIGGRMHFPRPPDFCVEDVYAADTLVCAVFGSNGRSWDGNLPPGEGEDPITDLRQVSDPSGPHAMFYYPLYFRQVSPGFLALCARIIAECADLPIGWTVTEGVTGQLLELGAGRYRLLLGNDRFGYMTIRLDFQRLIRSVKVRTNFPASRIEPNGSVIRVRLPPRGAVVIDIKTGRSVEQT